MAAKTEESIFEKIAFEKLKKHLLESVGVNCEGYRPEYLKRRLDIRLKATNSKSYHEYLRYLKANPSENRLLLNDLTVNYTSFFRDPDVYQLLEKTVFPDLLSSKFVRIWSAGCATGEEPYSLAILLNEILKDRIQDYLITIHASDIDREAVEKASKGEYKANQLQGLNKQLLNKYFSPENGVYIVKDFVKRIVRFKIHDLMNTFPHKNLDLILCRNVMIYFSRESQQRIHMHFYNALRAGGYFVTGKTELLSGEPSKRFSPVDIKCRAYKKPDVFALKENHMHVDAAVADLEQKII